MTTWTEDHAAAKELGRIQYAIRELEIAYLYRTEEDRAWESVKRFLELVRRDRTTGDDHG